MKRVISVCLVLLLVVPVIAVAVCAAESGSDTLTWDGCTDNLFSVDLGIFPGILHYKVSDILPAIEDFRDGYVVTFNGISYDFSFDTLSFLDDDEHILGVADAYIIIVYDDFSNEIGDILPKGLYILYSEGAYLSALTISGYDGFVSPDVESDISPIYTGMSTFTGIIGSFFDLISNNPLFCALFAGALIMTCIPLYVSLRKNSH